MCGIVGYVGYRAAAPVIIEGLKKLEYRGYDSFGVATISSSIQVYKGQGRISEAGKRASELHGQTGIGHTRWATHGVPNDVNAHPHLDCKGEIAVVHNGIIENFSDLKRDLTGRGHRFLSETDTEVIVHLIEERFSGDLLGAVQSALPLLSGSYALLVMAKGCEEIIAAREGSPLTIGVGDGEIFAASDMTPLLEYTERAIFLEDGDTARLRAGQAEVFHEGKPVIRQTELVDWSIEDVKKGGFSHYMLKEIYEEPMVYSQAIRGVTLETVPAHVLRMRAATMVACGSSYHAALLFKYLLGESCQIPVTLELSSEFKYYTPPVRDLVIGITQSGETADTIAALKVAKTNNCHTLAITNILGSSITRIADHTLYMRAGPEISVAATKSFIAEVAVFLQMTNLICRGAHEEALARGNRAMEEALLTDLSSAVALCKKATSIFYVGRGPFYPVALEGALKMKEISYIHAEGYAAGEIKHGPFALLSPETPVVAICTKGSTYGAMLSNIKEIKARGSPVIALGERGDSELADIVDVYIPLPAGEHVVHLLTTTVLLQLLAYLTADALGRDIDRPRNLAKSVTVE